MPTHACLRTIPRWSFAAVAAVREVTDRAVVAKLSPEVPDIAPYAVAAERAGADAVTVMNTITGMLIDVRTRRPVLANGTGGLSGPAILPIAVRQVFQAAQRGHHPRDRRGRHPLGRRRPADDHRRRGGGAGRHRVLRRSRHRDQRCATASPTT